MFIEKLYFDTSFEKLDMFFANDVSDVLGKSDLDDV